MLSQVQKVPNAVNFNLSDSRLAHPVDCMNRVIALGGGPFCFASAEGIRHSLRWIECAIIITALATITILSATGILPTGYLIASIGSVCLLSANIIIGFILKTILNRGDDSDSEYKKDILKASLFYTAVLIPFLEEALFRGSLQKVCQSILEKIIVGSAIVILGFPFSMAALGAIFIASAIFGAMHYFNPHKNSDIQAIVTTIDGIFWGILFYQYGLPAAILAHCVNNCIVMTCENLFGRNSLKNH